MPEDSTQLEELFHSLRAEGFALAPRDLIEVGRAMQAGFGVDSLPALYRCLQALWVRRPQGTEIFDRQFRRVIGDPGLSAPAEEPAKPEPEEQQAPEPTERVRQTPKPITPELDLNPVPIESSRREPARAAPSQRPQPSRPWKYLPRREVWEPEFDQLQPPAAMATLPASSRRIDTGLLNYAGAAGILHRLKRQPGQASLDLDVRATIERIADRGYFLEPVMQARPESLRLLVLVDEGGSMTPFRPMVRTLLDALKVSMSRVESQVFFFRNLPQTHIFHDSANLQPTDIDPVLRRARAEDRKLVIVSDAGLARRRQLPGRIAETGLWLEHISRYNLPIGWLNPVPAARWQGGILDILSQFEIPLQELTNQGLAVLLAGFRDIRPGRRNEPPDDNGTRESQAAIQPFSDHRLLNRWLKKFPEHYAYLLHCALPVSLTPELAWGLWGGFRSQQPADLNDFKITAVSDLLLSPLCRQVGPDRYQFEPQVRQALMQRMAAEPGLGLPRLRAVAAYLQRFIANDLSRTPPGPSMTNAQFWAARSMLDPTGLRAEITDQLRQIENRSESGTQWLLNLVPFVLPQGDPQNRGVTGWAEGLRYARTGQKEKAAAILSEISSETTSQVEGPDPSAIFGMAQESAPPLRIAIWCQASQLLEPITAKLRTLAKPVESTGSSTTDFIEIDAGLTGIRAQVGCFSTVSLQPDATNLGDANIEVDLLREFSLRPDKRIDIVPTVFDNQNQTESKRFMFATDWRLGHLARSVPGWTYAGILQGRNQPAAIKTDANGRRVWERSLGIDGNYGSISFLQELIRVIDSNNDTDPSSESDPTRLMSLRLNAYPFKEAGQTEVAEKGIERLADYLTDLVRHLIANADVWYRKDKDKQHITYLPKSQPVGAADESSVVEIRKALETSGGRPVAIYGADENRRAGVALQLAHADPNVYKSRIWVRCADLLSMEYDQENIAIEAGRMDLIARRSEERSDPLSRILEFARTGQPAMAFNIQKSPQPSKSEEKRSLIILDGFQRHDFLEGQFTNLSADLLMTTANPNRLPQEAVKIPLSDDIQTPSYWVLIDDPLEQELDPESDARCRRIGKIIVQEGYGLLTGTVSGINKLVAEGFAEQLAEEEALVEDYLHPVIAKEDRGSLPEFINPAGVISVDEWEADSERIRRADALVVIQAEIDYKHAGAAQSDPIAAVALEKGIPVIPLSAAPEETELLRRVLSAWQPGQLPVPADLDQFSPPMKEGEHYFLRQLLNLGLRGRPPERSDYKPTENEALYNLGTLPGHHGRIQHLTWNTREGTLLASAGADRFVRVWDISDPNRPAAYATIPGHDRPVTTCAWDQSGQYLVSGDAGGRILLSRPQVRHMAEQKGERDSFQESVESLSAPVNAIAQRPDGIEWLVAGRNGQMLFFEDEQLQKVIKRRVKLPIADACWIDHDFIALATGHIKHRVHISHWRSPDSHFKLPIRNAAKLCAIQSNRMLLIGTVDGRLAAAVVEPEGKFEIRWERQAHADRICALSAGFGVLISAANDGMVGFWDIETGNLLTSIKYDPGHDAIDIGLTFHHYDPVLATVDAGGSLINLWQAGSLTGRADL